MDPLQKLLDLHDIQQLRARYWRFWDGKEFDNWLDQFTDDAEFEVVMGLHSTPADAVPLKVKGKEQFRRTLIRMNLDTRTVHRGHQPEIEIHSDTEASGIWAMDDIIERPDETIVGHGFYEDRYRKVDGQWRFAFVRLTRTRMSITSR